MLDPFIRFVNSRLALARAMKGSIEPGKYADFVVIDRDILTCPIDEVKDTEVLMTVIDGKVVFETNNVNSRIKSN